MMMKSIGPQDALELYTTLSDDDLDDFLNKTENATFGFFILKIKESNSIYLMAILMILCIET